MIKPLTSLRFVFAFLVFMSHMNLFPHEEPGFLWHLFYEGYAGVSFFFMLSGFILAYTYQQRLIDGTATVRSFYVARIARIYPLHLLALFVALFFLQFFKHPSPADFFHLGINTFLLQSFIPGQEFLFNSVSWSLSDEAFFYAFFPLIVFSTFRDRRRGTILFWSVLGCVIVVSAYLLRDHPWANWVLYINPLFRIFDFLLGIALYNLCLRWASRPVHISYTKLEWLALLLLLAAYGLAFFIPESFRQSVWYWIPMGLLIATFYFHRGAISRFLSHRLFVKLGEISFAFYLFHFQTIQGVRIVLDHLHLSVSLPGEFGLAFMATLVIAYIAHQYIEQPLNRLIRKRFSS